MHNGFCGVIIFLVSLKIAISYWMLLSGCRVEPSLTGRWKLESEHAVGEIRTENGSLNIGLWGETWGTDGMAAAHLRVEEHGNWLDFPVQSGLGEGRLKLRLQGSEAMLPLGGRRGEFDLIFNAELEASLEEFLNLFFWHGSLCN